MSYAADPHPKTVAVTDKSTGVTKHRTASSAAYKESKIIDVRIPSQNALSPGFPSGQLCVFDWKGMDITYVKKVRCQVQILNSDPTLAATLVPAPFLFQSWTIFANEGNGSLQLYPDTDWFVNLQGLDPCRTACRAQAEGWNYTTGLATNDYTSVGQTIAAGATATYWIELNTFINQSGLPVHRDVCKPFRFEGLMCTNPLISTSAMTNTAHLSVTNVVMYVTGEKLHDGALKKLKAKLATGIHQYSASVPWRTSIGLNALASGAQFTASLSTLDGHFSSIIMLLRQQSASSSNRPEQQYQYDHTAPYSPSKFQLDQIALLGDGGVSWYNTQTLTDVQARILRDRDFMDSFFPLNFRAYDLLLNSHPIETEQMGRPGWVKITRNWQIQAIPIATGGLDCEMVLIGMRRAEIDLCPDGTVQLNQV